MRDWTNDEAIRRWGEFPREALDAMEEAVRLGCHLGEMAEPALDPAIAAAEGQGAEAYVHLPNFLVVAMYRA
jgi:hypothetical protein